MTAFYCFKNWVARMLRRALNISPLKIQPMEKAIQNKTRCTSNLRKLFWALCVGLILTIGYSVLAMASSSSSTTYSPLFEKAVEIIKKYEGMHYNKGQFIGYGHKILAGEGYKKNQKLTLEQADALLRKDLTKLCANYRSFGKDSLLLAALAYNCGVGTVAKSSLYKNLKAGTRVVEDIKASYLSHSKSGGKTLTGLKNRRIEEFEYLFIP